MLASVFSNVIRPFMVRQSQSTALVYQAHRQAYSTNKSENHHSFDLIVIGSGPAGQKCAIDAAKKLKNVALIDNPKRMGGVCTHTGTIPSKTFREGTVLILAY